MRKKLLDVLACPDCHGTLQCESSDVADDSDVIAGKLICQTCEKVFPIERGIPRFVPSGNYATSFGYQWNRFRREQIDSLNGTRQSEKRLLSETAWADEWWPGKYILDAGCGAGRFLEVASRNTDCDVVGVDISSAIDAAQETVAGRSNAHLVQASIFNLPFRPGSFDGVYCIGVIQHTPDPPSAIESLADNVKEGGEIAVTIYERRWFTLFYSKYWLRPLTTRISPAWLLTLIKSLMPFAFALSEVLFRVPYLKKVFQFVLPVANYVEAKELSLRQRYQWAILDTFDMLAPAYDKPQREDNVVKLLTARSICDIRRLPNAGLNLVGRKSRDIHDVHA